MSYSEFLASKAQLSGRHGFTPTFRPSWLYDFQSDLVEWATWKGRAAIFGDCGLGKTPMQLVWAQNVVAHTNRPVIILAPLACVAQTVREAAKFSIDAVRHEAIGRATIVVSNYERLHHYDPADFAGIVCDESSILKNFDGATKAAVTEFARRLPYRLLCTATPAPNDQIELGTSSEALGELGYTDMLGMFFKNDEGSIEPLSYATKWRLKPHATTAFYRWLCSWARAFRSPADLGFADDRFVLPALITRVHTVAASRPLGGMLFTVPAQTLQEQREERRVTIQARCELVAEQAVDAEGSFVAWCHLNAEGDLLEKLIPDAQQISGAQSDERKEELFEAFATGQLQRLVIKPKIGAHGMNWQHCARMSVFPSHSYEQYYQAVRRCWRFGQTRPVTVDVVASAGEADVLGNLQRKAAAADAMFAHLVTHMREASAIDRPIEDSPASAILPAWLTEVPA